MQHHLTRFLFPALAVLLVLPAVATAQGFIEHIEPPVVERGQTTRVTFVGRELAKALDVWHSLPSGAITAKPIESGGERAVFDVTIAATAPVGICGVRVATVDGLSNLHLFLVDDLPVRPGATDETPRSLVTPAAVWGTLREGAVDRYHVDLKAGEHVAFEVVANRFGKDADPLVTIRDAAGRFVAERDNDPGLYFDCRFAHPVNRTGRYTVEVRDARFKGNEHRSYVLRIGRFPTGRAAIPAAVSPGINTIALGAATEPPFPYESAPDQRPGAFTASFRRPGDNGSAWAPLTTATGPVVIAHEDGTPTPATIPATLCGVFRRPGVKHTFAFTLEKGQKLYFRGETESINSPAELEIAMVDRNGTVAAFRVKGEPAKVSVLPGETAEARLVVERVGNFDGAVTVRFNPNSGLTLPEQIVIPRGQSTATFAVPIPADTPPRTFNLQAISSGEVTQYEEEIRGSVLSIEVRKPEVPKKK